MHESMISRLRRRIGALLVCKHAVGWLTLWAFLWGSIVIVGRMVTGATPDWLWWGLWSAVGVAFAAGCFALTRLPERSSLRALMDRTSQCGGLLMASEEQDLGHWEESLPDASRFRVRWQGGRSLSFLSIGVLFVAVTLLFPQRLVSWTPDPELEIGSEVTKLSAQINILKEEAIVEEERADAIQKKLKQVQDEASGRKPEKTLEALDHVRDMISQAAQQAAQSALRKTENLGKAEGLADAMNKTRDALADKVQQEAFTELAALVKKAAAESNLLSGHLDPELLKELQKASNLSPEQLKMLADALRGAKMDVSKMLGKLHAAKLIDAEFLKMCEKAGHCDCAGMLKEFGGKLAVAKILGKCQGGCLPGIGGVSEGPGSAAIAWNQNTSENGVTFKEEVLPPGSLAKLKESMLVGVGSVDPKAGKEVGPSTGGALDPARGGGGSAVAPTVLPRHKAAVERFFARPKKQ